MSASPIAAALQAFETERAHLLARVAKLDELIARTREAFHLPTATPAGKRRRASVEPLVGANGSSNDELPASIVAALKDGPLSAAALIERSEVSRYLIGQFAKRGLLTATGATASRRYALPGRPAKEAP